VETEKEDITNATVRDMQRVKRVLGSNPALHYRGNALKRSKIWAQHRAVNMLGVAVTLLYKYTGWCWAIANAQVFVECLPKYMQQLCNSVKVSNHFIFTVYEKASDNIGQHSDKLYLMQHGYGFLVVKGGPGLKDRVFRVMREQEIVMDVRLKPGDAIYMSPCANELYTHGVPETDKDGLSFSIVYRCVDVNGTGGVGDEEYAFKQVQAAKTRARLVAKKAAKREAIAMTEAGSHKRARAD